MTQVRALASNVNLESVITSLGQTAVHFAIKLTMSVFVLVFGLWVAGRIANSIKRAMARRNLDASLRSFIGSFVNIILRILVIIISLTTVGVQMTSIVAVLGASALAVGMALSGTMQNFAGGIIILFLKPFRVGDTIANATGVRGMVKKIKMFTTEIHTADNQVVFLPNGALANGEITNLSSDTLRRGELTVGVAYGTKISMARRAILDILVRDPRVVAIPEPTVVVGDLGTNAITLTVRYWTTYSDLSSVGTDTLEQIYNELPKRKIKFPSQQMDVRIQK